MRVLFNVAMRWELIPYQLNPMSLVRVKDGSKRMREPRVLSVDEFLQILEHIPEPFRTMRIVAMCMGLRVSEVLGLKCCDVDREGMRIGIRQSYVYGKSGAVKTPASQRWMPLDPSLAKKLRQHQSRYASPANKDDWVFANPDTGKPYWPGRIQENWLVLAAEKVGIGRIGWHTFRHSHSSLLHALGVDLKVQQELLRHADLRMLVGAVGIEAIASFPQSSDRDTTFRQSGGVAFLLPTDSVRCSRFCTYRWPHSSCVVFALQVRKRWEVMGSDGQLNY